MKTIKNVSRHSYTSFICNQQFIVGIPRLQNVLVSNPDLLPAARRAQHVTSLYSNANYCFFSLFPLIHISCFASWWASMSSCCSQGVNHACSTCLLHVSIAKFVIDLSVCWRKPRMCIYPNFLHQASPWCLTTVTGTQPGSPDQTSLFWCPGFQNSAFVKYPSGSWSDRLFILDKIILDYNNKNKGNKSIWVCWWLANRTLCLQQGWITT